MIESSPKTTRETTGLEVLKSLQDSVWQADPTPPVTCEEALGRLARTLEDARAAFTAGQLVQAQTGLEDTLCEVLTTLKMFSLEPGPSLLRSLARREREREQRVFRVYPERVEIWAGSVCRGQWPLLTEDDYQSVLNVARELGCRVEYPDATQLGLFGGESHDAS